MSEQDARDIRTLRDVLTERLQAVNIQLAIEANFRDPWNGPLHAADVGALNMEYQWVNVLLNSVLFNYETTLNSWALNDPEYKRRGMFQPPKPPFPASLAGILAALKH
jgi:hypothetical protein